MQRHSWEQGVVETDLAQILAYTIFRGVQGGRLERKYVTAAEGMRRTARSKVDEYGLVQGVCGAPSSYGAGTAPEAGAFPAAGGCGSRCQDGAKLKAHHASGWAELARCETHPSASRSARRRSKRDEGSARRYFTKLFAT